MAIRFPMLSPPRGRSRQPRGGGPLASIAARPRQLFITRPAYRRFVPAEGWMTVALHLAIVLVAARAIEREDWADGLTILTPVAIVGVVTGLTLAKTRIA